MQRQEINGFQIPMFWSLEEELLKRTSKGIISKWSAASWWGFSNLIDTKYYVTFEKGQNFSLDKKYFIVNWKAKGKYSKGIMTFQHEGTEVSVYSPERTLVEIIKDAKGIYDDVLVKAVRTFFEKIEYNYNELLDFAKEFNILEIVKVFIATMNGQ